VYSIDVAPGLGLGHVAGFCECGGELSCFINSGEFLE